MGQMKNIVIDMEEMKISEVPMLGEVFEDGQFRGHLTRGHLTRDEALQIGDYVLWDGDDGTFYILFEPTGEMGAFKKEDFVAHVSAFFGLHF